MVDMPFVLLCAAMVAIAVWSLQMSSRDAGMEPAYVEARSTAAADLPPTHGLSAAFGDAAAVRNLLY